MNKIQVKEILELAQGEPFVLTLDDELFDKLTYDYDNYTYDILENELKLVGRDFLDIRHFDYKTIRDIQVKANKSVVLNAIEKAHSLKVAFAFITIDNVADADIDKAYDKKMYEMFQNHLSTYIRILKVEIQEKINSMGYNLSVESVFNEMVVNITKKKKIENRADFDLFRQTLKSDKDLIEKIIKGKEREIF